MITFLFLRLFIFSGTYKGSASGKQARQQHAEIKCPSLDKLLAEMEEERSTRASMKSYAFLGLANGVDSVGGVNLALKGEIDFLQGRNEELRAQLMAMRVDLKANQMSLARAEEEAERLGQDVKVSVCFRHRSVIVLLP